MIDRERALAIQQRALRDWVVMMGSSSPGARVLERDGVTAAAVPACPERSIANSVAFSDPAALRDRLDELAAFHEEAGVLAWTVWVPEFDTGTIARLEAAGHSFDGKPKAMVLELADLAAREIGDLDWDERAEPQEFGRLQDLAYEIPSETGMARALTVKADSVRIYRARANGETASVMGTIDHGGEDLGVYFVATHPDHRGKGLASRLMALALSDARERGLATSSLQASTMGEPVYLALGYRPHFRWHMYERRKPAQQLDQNHDPGRARQSARAHDAGRACESARAHDAGRVHESGPAA